MGRAIPLPSVFDYDDYRAFLRDLYAVRKRADPRYSYGVFARRAGLGARSHYKMIAGGLRNLAPETVEKYVKALPLDAAQGRFFRALVALSQGRSERERDAARRLLLRMRWEREHRTLSVPEADALTAPWARLLVIAMSRLKGFRNDPRWVARHLAGEVSVAEAKEALAYLRAHGYLRFRGGRLVGTSAGSIHIQRHRQGESAAASSALRRRILDVAAAYAALPHRIPTAKTAFTVLTQAEALELSGRLNTWLQENLPRKRRLGLPGNLYIVHGDIFPLTDFPEKGSLRVRA